MGGQQAIAAAALNRHVSLVLANEPSGADTNAALHGRRPGYPNWPVSDAAVMRTAPYFDIANLAPRITATTVIAAGFVDQTSPPTGIWATFNRLRSAKELIPMVESDHDTPERQVAWRARTGTLLSAAKHDLPIALTPLP